jgi:hypothetical protein
MKPTRTLQALFQDFQNWSLRTFTDSTSISCLRHLETEIKEIEENSVSGDTDVEEWVDGIMCLLSGAAREGFTAEDIAWAFERKLEKNKSRTWAKNDDNTYSHTN